MAVQNVASKMLGALSEKEKAQIKKTRQSLGLAESPPPITGILQK
jgi:hypothetical protein